MEHISKQELEQNIGHLKALKIQYLYTVTGSRITLRSKIGDYYYNKLDDEDDFSQSAFISKIQKHILSRNLSHLKRYKQSDITYHRYSKLKPCIIKEAFEVDINGAYWSAAKKLNIISQAMYEEGLKVKKLTRLTALGMLAKNPVRILFDGKKEKVLKDEPANTSYIWYSICKDVSDTMCKAIKKLNDNDFIFMWVDNIYFKRRENINVIKYSMLEDGYESKLRVPYKLEVDKTRIIIHDSKTESRPFPIVQA